MKAAGYSAAFILAINSEGSPSVTATNSNLIFAF